MNTNIGTKPSLLALIFNTFRNFRIWRKKGVQMCQPEINWKNFFSSSAAPPLIQISQIPLYSKGSNVYLPKLATCIELSKLLKRLVLLFLYRSLKHLVIVVNLWLVSLLIQRRSTGSVLFTLLSPSWILLVEDLRVWRVKPR